MAVMELSFIQPAWGQLLRLAECYSGSPSTTVQTALVTILTTCRLLGWNLSDCTAWSLICWWKFQFWSIALETILSQVFDMDKLLSSPTWQHAGCSVDTSLSGGGEHISDCAGTWFCWWKFQFWSILVETILSWYDKQLPSPTWQHAGLTLGKSSLSTV